ncbi:hypothetical protein COOONC_01429 [Cooperia oncophora]
MEKVDPVTAAKTYSLNLQRIPFRDILSWNLLMTEYKPDRIMEIIEMLSPKNMFYVVAAKQYSGQESNIQEPIFGTEMRVVDIDEKQAKGNDHPSPEKSVQEGGQMRIRSLFFATNVRREAGKYTLATHVMQIEAALVMACAIAI